LSENIEVKSVMGRFLEHAPIFYFHDGGEERVMLSSGEWMERSLSRRIEICFLILDPILKARVIAEGLKPYLTDRRDVWQMAPDGTYERRSHQEGASAQDTLLSSLT
jgi:polyphosphate kinase